jgi:hypothetical protein
MGGGKGYGAFRLARSLPEKMHSKSGIFSRLQNLKMRLTNQLKDEGPTSCLKYEDWNSSVSLATECKDTL